MWIKYNYLCTNCDSLIEVTSKVPPAIDPDCVCGMLSHIIFIGSEDATVRKVTA
jgi:hypothetical protein